MNKPKITLFFVCFVFLVFALVTYRDFGATFSEPVSYARGKELLSYWSNNTGTQLYTDPAYNAYSAAASMFNHGMSLENYHLINLAFALLLLVVSFAAVYKHYYNKFFAVLIPIFIFLTPRFLGHLPAEPENVPFAVMYISTLFIIYLLETSKRKWAKDVVVKSLLLGLLFGLTQSLRGIGYTIYLLYLFFVLHKIFVASEYKHKLPLVVHYVKVFFLVAVIAHLFMLATWPFVGSNPWQNLPSALTSSVNFPEQSQEFLFDGVTVTADTTPFVYLFTWLALTTPPFFLIFFLAGILLIKRTFRDQLYMLFVASFWLQIVLYVLIRPPIYDGLKFYLFLLVDLVVLASLNFIYFLESAKKSRTKIFLYGAAVLCLGFVTYQMYKLHPYEYIYFNKIRGNLGRIQNRYPLEYGGTSYKEAADWVAADIKSSNRTHTPLVFTCGASAAVEYYGRGTFELTKDTKEADYIICPQKVFNLEPTYKIVRDGALLNSVYKISY